MVNVISYDLTQKGHTKRRLPYCIQFGYWGHCKDSYDDLQFLKKNNLFFIVPLHF